MTSTRKNNTSDADRMLSVIFERLVYSNCISKTKAIQNIISGRGYTFLFLPLYFFISESYLEYLSK